MGLHCCSFLIALLAFCGIASEASGSDLFRQIAAMLNDERQKIGLPRLAYNDKLEQAALAHSQWMARVGKMEHLQGERPADFRDYLRSDHNHATRILKTGYLSVDALYEVTRDGAIGHVRTKPDVDERVSEIIAYASPGTGSVQQQLPTVVPGWMKSPGHRAVIVKTCWKELGAAFAVSRNGSTYYCITFGQPIHQR